MSDHTPSEHLEFFYGKPIHPDQQQTHIQRLLAKYSQEPVTEELKKSIYDELMLEKSQGRVTIPFKVILKQNTTKSVKSPYIEIILDTRV